MMVVPPDRKMIQIPCFVGVETGGSLSSSKIANGNSSSLNTHWDVPKIRPPNPQKLVDLCPLF